MGLFDLLKIPINKVTSDTTGAYGGLFDSKPVEIKSAKVAAVAIPKAEPVKMTAPTLDPLASLARPIGSVTPLQKATEGTQNKIAPKLDQNDPMSFLKAPIASVAGGVQVRKQDWKDVANLPTQVGGFLVGPAIDALLSLGEAVTGKTPHFQIKNPFPEQGAIPADSPTPDWFKTKVDEQAKQSVHPQVVAGMWEDYVQHHNEGLKTGYKSKTSQEYYIDQLDNGVPDKQAFWNTAAKTVLDMSVLVPIARDVSKLALLKTAPEKLIESSLVKSTRDELRNFVSGADTYAGKASPVPKEIQEAFKAASTEDKIRMLRGSGIEVVSAKPSALGRLVGISEEEATQLIEEMAGKGAREASSGALPGYREKSFNPIEEMRARGQAGFVDFSGKAKMEPVGFGDKAKISVPEGKNPVKKLRASLLKAGFDDSVTNLVIANVVDKVGAGNKIKLDDVLKTVTEMENATQASSKPISDYVYHTTSPDRLQSIQKEGLRPNEGQYGTGVYFAPTPEQTGGYGSAEGALLRIDRSKLPQDWQEFPDQGWTGQKVPANALEVSTNGGKSWKELSPTLPDGSGKGQKSEVVKRGGEKELATTYKNAGQSSVEGFSKADEELSHILTDMETAFPGNKYQVGYGKDAEVRVERSTFPQWVPENLRLTKLFNKVIPDLDNIKYPKGSRQRALYDAIFDELDARLGVDTQEIRSRIKAHEDQVQKGDAKASGGSSEGSRGRVKEKGQKEIVQPDRPPFGPGSEEAPKSQKISDEGRKMSTRDVQGRIDRRTNRKLEKMAYQAPTYEAFFDRSGVTQEALDATAVKMGAVDAKDFYTKVKQDASIAKEMDALVQKEVAKTLKQLQDTRIHQAKENAEGLEEEKLSKKEKMKLWASMSAEDAVASVEPPTMKNGKKMPVLDHLYQWKDKSPLMLSRETPERNIEKVVAPEDQAKVKEWFLDPITNNETDRIKFANKLRGETEKKIVEELGIRRKSGVQRLGQKAGKYKKNILTELVQRYGEGNQGEFPLTLSELKRIEPDNWMRVKEGAEYFREKYSLLLEMVNKKRAEFDYAPIPARPDYFRHFKEMGDYISRFGLIMKSEDLPGSMTGLTGIFKPGKPFSTAELKRMGKKTDIDAVAGFDNYIDTITRQIFHIDSVQRGRALEKYVREAMEASETAAKADTEKLILGNFANNLKETTNMVSGKKSDFDRAGEARFGRKIYASSDWLKQRASANMVGANVASAMTNFAPFVQSLATTEKGAAVRGLSEALTLPAKKEPFSIDGVESKFLVRRFPVEKIDPRGMRKAEEKAGWIFRGVDQFVSTAVVSGKYYENLGKGMSKEAAMKDADSYVAKIIGDRSVGQVPVFLKDKGLGFLTQFQLEVNNVWSFMIHDMPNMSGKNKVKYASMLAQFIIYSYLFNEAYEKLTGRRPLLDPVYLALTIMGATPASDQATLPKKVVLAGQDLAGNVPFIGGFTGGRFPAFSIIPNVVGALKGDTTWSKELAKVPMIALPFGGLQAKKTYQGIEALARGYTETTNGDKKVEVKPTVGNMIKAPLFGPSAIKETLDKNPIVSDLYARIDTQKAGASALTAQAEKLDAELRKMKPEEADKNAQAVAESNPALFEKLKKVVTERELGLTQEERLIKQLNVESRARYVDEMLRKKKPEDADKYLNELITKKVVTEKVLTRLTEIVQSGESAPAVPTGTKLKEDSVIDRAVTYAKALGTDPVTAFNRIFTGQTIRYVKNGTLVVERLPLSESEAEAQRQLTATSTKGLTRGAVKLDHTVPLELGGSNSRSNLRLVTTAEWQKYTPIENFLGDELGKGTITKKQAQELIQRFKAGELSAEEVRSSVRQ